MTISDETHNWGERLWANVDAFVAQLRSAGVPISLSEHLDATRALEYRVICDRETLRWSLAATLIKNDGYLGVFHSTFDVFFGSVIVDVAPLEGSASSAEFDQESDGDDFSPRTASEGGDAKCLLELTDDEMQRLLAKALASDDDELRASLARFAVHQFAQIEHGRPVGASYYLFKATRGLQLDAAFADAVESFDELSAFERRLAKDRAQRQVDKLKAMIETEIRRRLVAERGPTTVARSFQRPLPEDVDFLHASRQEVQVLTKAVYPLARKLAARLARKRRNRRRGPVDFRGTVRRSLTTGGVPVDVQFRYPKPTKPELFVVADISGSVAAFARFTLHLMDAIAGQFSQVRAFVFIDGLDEVTGFFESADDTPEAISRINAEADVIAADGHSNYGLALQIFWDTYGRDVSSKSTVLFLGDARNNYHATNEHLLRAVQHRARRVFWLNPEPEAYWDTGDSVMSEYSQFCDETVEARNLRQVERFVDKLA